eukprot:5409539-Prymnesium_polylepis.2
MPEKRIFVPSCVSESSVPWMRTSLCMAIRVAARPRPTCCAICQAGSDGSSAASSAIFGSLSRRSWSSAFRGFT